MSQELRSRNGDADDDDEDEDEAVELNAILHVGTELFRDAD